MKNESGSTIDPADELKPKDALSPLPLLNQRYWRWAGLGSLVVAGLLAVFASYTEILRDSLVAIALLISDEAREVSPAYPLFFYIVYWGLFGFSVFGAFYMGLLDLRYIRLEYTLEKRAIMKESWEDEDFRAALKSAAEKGHELEKHETYKE